MKRNQPVRDFLRKVAEHPNRANMTFDSLKLRYALSDTVYSKYIRRAPCLDYLPEKEHNHHKITQVFPPALDTCEETQCPWLKHCSMINKEMF